MEKGYFYIFIEVVLVGAVTVGDKLKKRLYYYKKSVEGAVVIMWKRNGVNPVIPVFQSFHRLCPLFIHLCGKNKAGYPSLIFFLISSRLRLNSASSLIIVSIRLQADIAVV